MHTNHALFVFFDIAVQSCKEFWVYQTSTLGVAPLATMGMHWNATVGEQASKLMTVIHLGMFVMNAKALVQVFNTETLWLL